jgi:hypothetical protein
MSISISGGFASGRPDLRRDAPDSAGDFGRSGFLGSRLAVCRYRRIHWVQALIDRVEILHEGYRVHFKYEEQYTALSMDNSHWDKSSP